MASADGVYSVATANREEAARAKEIALQKLQAKDWDGAKRLLLKAQRLCPDLDGVAACIIVAEVHIIAESTTHTSPYLGISRDYYAILDVRPDVTKQALSQQYKKRAFQLHPDKNQNPGAEAAFKLLGEAFETLKDDEKRRKYDNLRSRTPYQNSRPAPHPQQRAPNAPGGRGPYSQPFGGGAWLPNFFAGGRGGYQQAPPQRPVPRDSSGNAFAGYNVNGQGRAVPMGRQSNPPGGSQAVPPAPSRTAQPPPGSAGQQRPTATPYFRQVPPTPQPVSAGMRRPGTQVPNGQPGAPSTQSGTFASRPGSAPSQQGPFSRQPGASVNQPGAFPSQPGIPVTQQGAFAGAPAFQPGVPPSQPGAFATQPGAFAQGGNRGVAQGAQNGAQGFQPGYPQPQGQQTRPPVTVPGLSNAPPGRFISTCSSCFQKYTFPVLSKDKWVRCQKCSAPFEAHEDPPGGSAGVAGGAAPSAPRAPAPSTATAPNGAPPTVPSAPEAAPFTRVEAAWAEAVKIRKDHKKEQKREERQLRKEEKERELDHRRERQLAIEKAKQRKAEERARRHKEWEERQKAEKARREKDREEWEKADAANRAKVFAEGDGIPLRPEPKPVTVETGGVNEPQERAGGSGGVGNDLGEGVRKQVLAGVSVKRAVGESDSDDEPIVRRKRKGKSITVEESNGNGLEDGTAKGADEQRKRQKTSYIELESDDEGGGWRETEVGREEIKARRRLEKGKAKLDAEGEGNGTAGEGFAIGGGNFRQTTGEEEAAALLDAAHGEVLPGRVRKRWGSVKTIGLETDVVDLLGSPRTEAEDGESWDPLVLFPARNGNGLSGVNGPSGVKRSLNDSAKSPPETEAGPSGVGEKRSRGEPSQPGEFSHQGTNEPGPSTVNGHDEVEPPDTLFFDFDESRKETDVQPGHFWAIYEDSDGMPRFYGRVDSVRHNPFRVRLTWLEATRETLSALHNRDPVLRAQNVSPGVGLFTYGSDMEYHSINPFAYRQTAVQATQSGARVFPRCAEVWAMFRLEKKEERTRHGDSTQKLQYDLVEVGGVEGGYWVTKLEQLPRYRTLFRPARAPGGGNLKVTVKPGDVNLFSHRVLGKRVPPELIESSGGSHQKSEIWELDPAALVT